MKNISIIIIGFLLFFPFTAFSETKEIISEGTYNMGDGETPSVAESRALLNAKRVALEQAGTYVESYSKVKNMRLTEDEVKVLASGLMEVTILDKKRTIVGDGFHFYVKIKAKVNPDKMEAMAKKVKEKEVVDDYKKIQEAYDKSQKEIEELKKQLAQAKDEKEKKKVETKIADDERLFQANEWFEKGQQYLWAAAQESVSMTPDDLESDSITPDKLDKVSEAFTRAIAINPNLDKAREAFTRAIAINPNNADAYLARAYSYHLTEQNDKAIEDYDKAIAINPNNARFYLARGSFYMDIVIAEGEDAKARAEEYTYKKRVVAEACKGLGSLGKAFSDFKKACDMGNEEACIDLREILKFMNEIGCQ